VIVPPIHDRSGGGPTLPSARSSTMSTALGLPSGSGWEVTSGRRSQLNPQTRTRESPVKLSEGMVLCHNV